MEESFSYNEKNTIKFKDNLEIWYNFWKVSMF